MLFCLYIAAIVVGTFVFWRLSRESPYHDSVWSRLTLLTPVLGPVVGSLLFTSVPAYMGTPYIESSTSYTLTALQTSSQSSGRYFLGTGSNGSSRTLNYILNDNGAYTVDSVNANRARIFQDSTEPTLFINEVKSRNTVLVPWSFGSFEYYEFHIPEDSILSDYTIDNE